MATAPQCESGADDRCTNEPKGMPAAGVDASLTHEFVIMQKKLKNKVEALLLVSQDLAVCQQDREKWKNSAENLTAKVGEFEKLLERVKQRCHQREANLTQQLAEMSASMAVLRCENNSLRDNLVESNTARKDYRGDVKVLRQKLAKFELYEYCAPQETSEINSTNSSNIPSAVQTRTTSSSASTCEEVPLPQSSHSVKPLEEIERLKEQLSQNELDLRLLLCEKEELVTDLEAFKKKYERISQELSFIMNGDDRRVTGDLDGVLAENRYLKELLASAQEETGIARAALRRYRSVLERRKKQQTKLAAASSSCVAAVDLAVVSPKQIRQLLGSSSSSLSDEQLTDYKALAAALFEAVNDKNLALSHQRKANKILGNRVTELESRLRQFEDKSPSKVLLSPPMDPGAGPGPGQQHQLLCGEPEIPDDKPANSAT